MPREKFRQRLHRLMPVVPANDYVLPSEREQYTLSPDYEIWFPLRPVTKELLRILPLRDPSSNFAITGVPARDVTLTQNDEAKWLIEQGLFDPNFTLPKKKDLQFWETAKPLLNTSVALFLSLSQEHIAAEMEGHHIFRSTRRRRPFAFLPWGEVRETTVAIKPRRKKSYQDIFQPIETWETAHADSPGIHPRYLLQARLINSEIKYTLENSILEVLQAARHLPKSGFLYDRSDPLRTLHDNATKMVEYANVHGLVDKEEKKTAYTLFGFIDRGMQTQFSLLDGFLKLIPEMQSDLPRETFVNIYASTVHHIQSPIAAGDRYVNAQYVQLLQDPEKITMNQRDMVLDPKNFELDLVFETLLISNEKWEELEQNARKTMFSLQGTIPSLQRYPLRIVTACPALPDFIQFVAGLSTSGMRRLNQHYQNAA